MKKEKILIQTNNYCLGWLPDEHNQRQTLIPPARCARWGEISEKATICMLQSKHNTQKAA